MHKDPYYFLTRQLCWTILSLVIMVVCLLFIDYRKLNTKYFVYTTMGVALFLLTYVLFSPGSIKRWIRVAGVSFQPSEFAKLAVLLYLAYQLQHIELPIKLKQSVLIAIPAIAASGLIIFEPDLGTGFIVALVAVILLFAVGLEKKYLFVMVLIGMLILGVLVNRADYRKDRVIAFWNQMTKSGTSHQVLKASFQLEQAKIAVGSGGIKGLGFGNSLQKLFYIPQPHNDFIFSIIAEELGLIGTLSIWILYLFIFFKGVWIAKHMPDRFGSYLALGIVLSLICQALINVSVVIGLMPTKGIPLPFISAGGSSMLMSLISIGILLNLSQHVMKETEE